MKNITLGLDEETLEAGRIYASRHETTLNAVLRQLLAGAVAADRKATVAEMFRLMDTYPGNSDGRGWTREELYVDDDGRQDSEPSGLMPPRLQ